MPGYSETPGARILNYFFYSNLRYVIVRSLLGGNSRKRVNYQSFL